MSPAEYGRYLASLTPPASRSTLEQAATIMLAAERQQMAGAA